MQVERMTGVAGRRASTAVAALLLSGCATLPTPQNQAARLPPERYDTHTSFAAPAVAWPDDAWWRGYGDPQLDALIDEALSGAPDLRAAAARVARADAIAKQAGAATLPSFDANASVQTNRQSYNLGLPAPRGWNNTGRATLDLSWELDFWGKNRAALVAATSQALAERAQGAAARLALSAAIASTYADLAARYADRAAAIEAVGVRGRTLALIEQRRVNGLENVGAVERARAALTSGEADLAAVDEGISLARNALAALLGAGPDRGRALAPPQPIRLRAFGLPETLAADLIGRRPDVVAARLRTEVAASRIKVARAGFFPSINLTAFIGLNSLTLDKFAEGNALFGSAGPAINLPIFRGGQLRGKYREAEADYDLAVAEYDGALAQALRDVVDAADSSRALTTRLDRARTARAAATAAWQVANNRYRGGLATYLDVLTAEDALVASRRSVAALEARGFTLDVALVRALGGGFRTEGNAA